jgi:hypothetical protein
MVVALAGGRRVLEGIPEVYPAVAQGLIVVVPVVPDASWDTEMG